MVSHDNFDLFRPRWHRRTGCTLRRAHNVRLFQVEGRAQTASIPRNAPTNGYDLVVQVAIIRPAPIAGKLIACA